MADERSHKPLSASGRASQRLPVRHYFWPVFLLALLCVLTLFGWRIESWQEEAALNRQIEQDARHLGEVLAREMEGYLDPLRALRREWRLGGLITQAEFAEQAAMIRQRQPVYRMVGWVGTAQVCHYVYPVGENVGLLGRGLDDDPAWGPLLERTISRHSGAGGVAVICQDGDIFGLVAMPLLVPEGRTIHYRGTFIAVVRLDPLFQQVMLKETGHNYIVWFFDGERQIAVIGDPSQGDGTFRRREHVHVLDREWILLLDPTHAHVARQVGNAPWWILIGGLFASFVLSGLTLLVMRHRWRNEMVTAGHMKAMESLTEISIAISRRIGSDQEVLEQLVDSARGLLGMSMAAIGLIDKDDRSVRMVATRNFSMPGEDAMLCPSDDPLVRLCLSIKDVVSVEDARRAGAGMDHEIIRLNGIRSILLIPLESEGRVIGCMMVADHRPRRFTDADSRLARLWGSQAAVTIVNSDLYRRMKQALRSREALLRELSHRVKNNLAGIISLLSFEERSRSPEESAWLNRVIGRIRAMAGAHHLFAGEVESTALEKIVGQVLSSLSVVRSAGVEIRTDVQSVTVPISADRAVSLAMVLHELCYNAIVHGLGGRSGVVTLSARVAENDRLIVEVADDGAGFVDQPRDRPGAGESSGMGLHLVRELVGRELRGTFSIHPREGGGTVATLAFPVGEKTEGIHL